MILLWQLISANLPPASLHMADRLPRGSVGKFIEWQQQKAQAAQPTKKTQKRPAASLGEDERRPPLASSPSSGRAPSDEPEIYNKSWSVWWQGPDESILQMVGLRRDVNVAREIWIRQPDEPAR